jgi:hypothetical protein
VNSVRRHILLHRRLASWLVAMALLMKLLVPVGFMPILSDGVMTVQLCSGVGDPTVQIAVPGLAGHHDDGARQKKADQPCVFSGLAAPTLSAADPILLAIAIAFIIAVGFRAAAPPNPLGRAYLRPPLRGPPATV